jgi:hypothetical protein
LLSPANRAGTSIVIPAFDPDNRAHAAAAGAQEFVGAILAGEQGDLPPFATEPKRPGTRAYYSDSKHSIGMPDTIRENTWVHEMGHGIERHIPGAKTAAREFLAHRVKDEPPRKLAEVLPDRKYASYEEGRKDDFDRAFGDSGWYCGKEYADGGTEILSMGLERLYEDPATFARLDPEFCAFILGVLDRSILEK